MYMDRVYEYSFSKSVFFMIHTSNDNHNCDITMDSLSICPLI